VPRAITLRSIEWLDEEPPERSDGPRMRTAVALFAGCFAAVAAAFGRRSAAVAATLDLAAAPSARVEPARLRRSDPGVQAPNAYSGLVRTAPRLFTPKTPRPNYFDRERHRDWSSNRHGAILPQTGGSRWISELRICGRSARRATALVARRRLRLRRRWEWARCNMTAVRSATARAVSQPQTAASCSSFCG
jgi:hypothetical protein